MISTQADGPISVYATDLDGDGDADVLSASFVDDKIAWHENRIGETALLSADVTELPGTAGGTQNFTLTAGQAYGQDFYLVLGTLSGTSPGFPIGGMTLPLNIFDPYFDLTLQQANSGAFVNTFGVLSSAGTANASLVVPPGSQFPSLIGLTFHHAYVVFELDLTVSLVSNAVELKLL